MGAQTGEQKHYDSTGVIRTHCASIAFTSYCKAEGKQRCPCAHIEDI